MNDREFIDAAAKGLKIEAEPFKPLAERLKVPQAEVIAFLKRLIEEGKVRRFAASVRHQPIGYVDNAMVIARVAPEQLEAAGEAASRLPAASHCYQRQHPDGDPHCLYIMVHAHDSAALDLALSELRALPGLRALEILRSRAELKKISLSGVTTS
jgi:siroheme decarboxylase